MSGETLRPTRCAFPDASALSRLRRESVGALRHCQDRLEEGAHRLDGAADGAFMFGFKEQRHQLSGEIEPVVEEPHQQAFRQRVCQSCAATNLTKALIAADDDSAFASPLELVEIASYSKPARTSLKRGLVC